MAMTPKSWSINALATEFRLDRRTVARRLSQAGVAPAGNKAGAPTFRLSDAARALLAGSQGEPAKGGRTCRLQLEPATVLERLQIPVPYLVPWSHPDVIPLDEYERSLGLDPKCGEILDWLSFGFPIVPPAPGEKLARVSRPHADLWRALFGLVIGLTGGNPDALHLGEEARRIRGLTLEPEAEPEEGVSA